jgi:hypothetical protein
VGGFCRDHKPFLDAAWNNDDHPLMVTIPVSDTNVADVFNPVYHGQHSHDSFPGPWARRQWQRHSTNTSGRRLWRIGNEVQLHQIPLENAVQVFKIIVDFENEKGISDNQKLVFTSDVDFGVLGGQPPGIFQLLALKQAFVDAGMSDIWYTRFIASINTKNEGPLIRTM